MSQIYENYQEYSAYSTFYGANWSGQTFTVGAEQHTVESIKLMLFKSGSPGTVTVSIRAVDGSGLPTGPDLTSGTINGNLFSSSYPGSLKEIEVTRYVLSPSTQYAFCIRAPSGDAYNYVGFNTEYADATYDGGKAVSSTDSGSSWAGYDTFDRYFEIWGNPSPVDYEVEITETLGMVDSITKQRSLVQEISDILGMTDSLPNPKASFKQIITEKIGMLDSMARSRGLPITISDILGMRDRMDRRKHLTKLPDLPDYNKEGGAPQ